MKLKKSVKDLLHKKINTKKILRKGRATIEIKEIKPVKEKSTYFKKEFEREKRNFLGR